MTWWQRLARRKQLDAQLEKELSFHLEQHTVDLIARGYHPREARRQASLALGGPEQVKEECRDARGTRWLQDLVRDVQYALRSLKRKPGFAAIALLTLALGIGATTVMFTVVNGVLLKPLPYPEPDKLVNLQEQTNWSTHWGNLWAFSYPNFRDCRRAGLSLDMAAWRYSGGTLSKPGPAEYVDGRQISAELLAVLGVTLSRGRPFWPEEDRTGATPVVIISEGLWRRRFAGSLEALGRMLVFDGKPYTIVGVTPAGFRIGAEEADVFTPIGQDTGPGMQNREAHSGIRVWARVRPGATLSQAQSELSLLGRRLAQEFPKSNAGRTFVAEPLRPDVGDVRSTLWLLLGAVSLVLLVACTNVASLLLARAASRERELAMRVALGARRGRLIRQCLSEGAVLGLGGGALGVLLAAVSIRPFIVFWPGSLPRAEEVHLDWHVLFFTLAVSLFSGLLFGLAPALRAPAHELDQALRAGAKAVGGPSRRLHGAFVICEIALAVVLLVATGMLGRTLVQLTSLDPGLDTRNVLVARMALSPATLSSPGQIRAVWDDVLERARRVPGVRSIAMVDTVPMREGNNQVGYWKTPAEPPVTEQPLVLANSVSPDYLKVMRLRLLRGRFFTDQDRMDSEHVVVIDDVMAQTAFGGNEPIGKRLWIGLDTDPLTVVGVVGHVRYWGPAGDDGASVRSQLYYSFAQVPDQYLRRWSELMSIAVRTRVEPTSLVETLRRELRGATNDQVLYEVHTMDQLASATLARQRFLLMVFGVFAGLALVLACIGIYGVLAYLTGQRVPEIGLRMALGASPRDVLWLVLRQSLGMILMGVGVGLAAALAAGHVLEHLVQGVRPNEPSTLAIVILFLAGAALFASFIPANRASRVDPMSALRQE